MRRVESGPISILLAVLIGTTASAMDRERVTLVGEEARVEKETPHPVPIVAAGEEAWRDVFTWDKASYIAVHFEKLSLAPGERVVVRSPDGKHSVVYEGEGRPGTGGTFWARHIPGDTAEVLYYGSGDARGWGYSVDMFAHGFPQEPGADFDTETVCGPGDDGEWAKCYATAEPMIYDKSRAIARLLINGVALCTGWLVGCEGHLMTNAHCITNPVDALNTEYEFMAEGATCGTDCSAQLSCPGVVEDVLGVFVKTGTQAVLDYTLVQLSPELASRYGFFRLRPTGAVPEERIYLNGHPGGKGKNFHVLSDDPVDGSGYCEIFTVDEPARTGCSAGSPPEAGYMCDSEGGSSGSPVVAYSDHRVVVLHHCGGCPNTGVHIADVIADLGSDLPNCALGQPDGRVVLGADAYSCSGEVSIQVVDDSIVGAGIQQVDVSSTTESTPETVALVETPPSSGVFTGTILLSVGPAASGDGELSVAPGDTISVLYVDADDGAGGTNIPRTDTAAVDCLGPVISNVAVASVSGDGATITWTTSEPATSTVHYGLSAPPLTAVASRTLRTSHRIELAGAASCSNHLFSVGSQDAAGNAARDDNGGAYYSFTTKRNLLLNSPSTDTPVAIPDNSTAGVESTIAVTDGVTVADVNVEVDITHPFTGDLELYLIPPAGQPILLADMRGDDGDNYTDTVFDDEAPTAIVNGAAPFTGSFRPERPLSAADGLSAAGEWKLKVVDLGPTDFGTLEGWTLRLTYAGACGVSLAHEATEPADACAGTGSGGNDIVEPGEDLVLPIRLRNDGSTPLTGIAATLASSTPGVTVTRGSASYPDVAVGATALSAAPHFAATIDSGVACGTALSFTIAGTANEGAFADTLELVVGVPGTEIATHASPNVPRPVPDLLPMTSTVAVADTRDVRDIDVELTVTHTYVEDLDVFLIAPNGARVELTTDNGGDGDDYAGTIFDDEADSSITEGAPPFTGRFRAEGSLAALDGIPANGTWTLELTDDTLQDVGVLESWSLILTTGPDLICDGCAVAAPPDSVDDLRFSSGSTLEWDPGAGAGFYNVYRGTPQDLAGLESVAVDSCRRLTAVSTTTDGALGDIPPAGSFYWYLVRAANSGGEGPAGDATSGPRIHDSAGDCP